MYAKAKRIAWWERRGSGGLRERDASRRSGVQLAAAICASIRRGQRERNGKGEGWTLCVVVQEGGIWGTSLLLMGKGDQLDLLKYGECGDLSGLGKCLCQGNMGNGT